MARAGVRIENPKVVSIFANEEGVEATVVPAMVERKFPRFLFGEPCALCVEPEHLGTVVAAGRLVVSVTSVGHGGHFFCR